MPTLLVAVPLSKSWLGLHYWKAPPLMELPVELEYIPYQEFEDRFKKLNKIARPIYPTFWPNVIMVFVFVGLAATAAIGMSQKGSALSIMGQGSCFILPVIVVLWIRIRKETKARSRKKFKHRSQKLLRAWTVQDTETHAIQWKLRLRPKAKSAARRWQGFTNSSTPNNTGLTEEENNQQDNNDDNRDRLNNTTVGASSTTYLSPNHPRLHQQASPQNSQEEQEQQEQGHQTSESASQSSSAQIIPPPRVADVYSALRNPTRITTDSTVLTTQPTVTTVATTTTVVTDMEGEGDLEAGPAPPRSKWEPWKELLMELYCCAYLFKQKKIWMIEISLRENLLDEYALPVPSPVYCDYRLPGYDDVMSGNLTPSTMVVQSATSTASTITVTRQGTIPTTRYLGSPPAYESDSENDSDDEDGQDDDEGIDSEAESVHLPTNAPVTRGSQSEMSSVASMSVAADSVHRPLEMTTIVIVPSIKDIRSGEDSSRDEGVEDRHEEVMRSMTSMTTLCASATTSRATLPMPLATVDSEDKEAGQSKERGD